MNRKNVNIFSSFAFPILVICSAVLPVFSFRNNMNISSRGTVNYPLNTWNLVVTVTPIDGGTTSLYGTKLFNTGQSVTVSATPSSGYNFKNWKLDNSVSTSNPITVPSQTSGSTHTLVAIFEPIVNPPDGYKGANLAPMPYGWTEWGGTMNNYLFIDYGVTHNGNPSIRSQSYVGHYPGTTQDCERDGFCKEPNYWIPIKPGDHIIFKCWMKLNAGDGQYNGAPEYSGARLGIDFYDNIGWIGDTNVLSGNPITSDAEARASYVNWGKSTWTLRTMDFYVRSSYSEGSRGAQVPKGMIPWIQVMPRQNSGNAWFADCELYVNPTGG